tara:strand:- start:988 stop:1320 length:333 start_codon:yes stop_codon:yes gene_type:complete
MTNNATLIALSFAVDAAAERLGLQGDVEHASWLAFKGKASVDADLLIGAPAFAQACIDAMSDGITECEFITRYKGRVVDTFRTAVSDPKAYRAAIAAKKPRCTVQYVTVG